MMMSGVGGSEGSDPLLACRASLASAASQRDHRHMTLSHNLSPQWLVELMLILLSYSKHNYNMVRHITDFVCLDVFY